MNAFDIEQRARAIAEREGIAEIDERLRSAAIKSLQRDERHSAVSFDAIDWERVYREELSRG